MTEQGYDPARLKRGATRAVRKIGPRQYLVRGNEEPRYVVDLDSDVPCTCLDAYWHGRGCLHELAARLQAGDTKLINGLAQMLFTADQRNKELMRRTKRRKAS